jgi:chromosome segregation and condensation protein ScpB
MNQLPPDVEMTDSTQLSQMRKSQSDSELMETDQKTAKQMEKEYSEFVINYQKTHEKVTIDNFEVLKVLGIGAYGKVLLVKKDGEIYAMKVIKKSRIKTVK